MNTWEGGQLAIPAAEWDTLKSVVRNAYEAENTDSPLPPDAGFFKVTDHSDIAFSEDDHTVHWTVVRGWNAGKLAHRTPVAQAFFKALDQISWDRGTGGTIVGNDEVNEDEARLGGGSNYIVVAFGQG